MPAISSPAALSRGRSDTVTKIHKAIDPGDLFVSSRNQNRFRELSRCTVAWRYLQQTFVKKTGYEIDI
jgi:hypothetical protein